VIAYIQTNIAVQLTRWSGVFSFFYLKTRTRVRCDIDNLRVCGVWDIRLLERQTRDGQTTDRHITEDGAQSSVEPSSCE